MNVQSDLENTQGPETANQEQTSEAQQLVDLDGMSSFKFQGETYTPDQFAEFFQNSQKYGEASQYQQDHEKFLANVDVDIEKVLRDPSLQSSFESTYPKSFHKLLHRELSRTGQETGAQNVNQQPQQLPKELIDRLSKVDMMEQRLYQQDVQAASSKIDALLPPLLAKYEMADEDKVLIEAEKLLNRGQKVTDATWERLVREDHEKTQKRADKVYGAKLKAQIEKGKQGQDTGAGGITTGQAPPRRTMEQAREAMIAHMNGQKR